MKEFEYEPYGTSRENPESLEQHGQRIVELLQDRESRIGEGRTAQVHHGFGNLGVCYKIIPDVESKFYNREPLYTDVKGEAGFLEALRNLDPHVRVPQVYGVIQVVAPYRADVLVLERLNAISVEDVVKRGIQLPVNFEIDSFFEKIKVFFEKMHARRIYHRDAHEGNIMIDVNTGNPYIIDFGSGKKVFLAVDDPYVEEDTLGGKRMYFTDDFLRIKLVRGELGKYLLTNK